LQKRQKFTLNPIKVLIYGCFKKKKVVYDTFV